jgi:nicotinamidase-related amidase
MRKTMEINKKDTAVLLTDVQKDFLSEQGVTWELVGDSVKENKTVDNIERLFKAAKANAVLSTDEVVEAMS